LSDKTTVRVESKRGVPKLKVILHNHHTTVPTVSPFDPWCDGDAVSIIDQEDVLDTVGQPICSMHYKWDVQWQTILNTTGGIFKNQGHLYAHHIHHQKAMPVDEPVSLQWNLNLSEQRECSTLLFTRSLREDPRQLWINKPTRDLKPI
jgi:hypothetical protein